MKLFVSALEYSANVHLRYLLMELAKYENVELCGIFDENILDSATRAGDYKNAESQNPPSLAEGARGWVDSASQKTFAINGKSICDINKVAVMGFVDVLKKMRFFLDLRKKCLNLAISADKILLMDSSSFNLPLAKKIKKIAPQRKIMYYILPQVWAWKAWRAKAVERYCDKLCAILPFEVERYAKKAEFVGHPLMDEIEYFRDSANTESNTKNGENLAESASLRHCEAQSAEAIHDSANAESKIDSSLRGSGEATTKQSKKKCHTERSEVSHFRFCDSVNPSPKHFLKFISFSQKGLHPPTPLPPTRQKAAAFSLLGGRASLNPLLAKNRHSHYCNLESDFLHHEAGEIKGASHGLDFNVDCHDSALQNLAMTEKSQNLDSANYAKNAESTEIFAFMPGSRLSEIRRIFPIFRQVKDILKKRADSANQAQFAESKIDSSLRGSVSVANTTKQSKQNLVAQSAPESRPLRGAKNRIQGCSSASADFLLEAEKRGTPPKSEKRELLARRGSGAGGAALLRKDSSESNDKNSETIADSAIRIKNTESNAKSQNLKRDSSLRTSHFAQNDKNPMDCHDFATQNLAMTENDALDSANETKIAKSCNDEKNQQFAESSNKNQHSPRRAPKFYLIIPHKFAGQNLAEIYGDLSDFEISFDAHRTLFQSDFAFICSGTATLECALIGTPFVLGYKTRAFEAFIARCFLKIKYIGLANILYEKIAEDSAFHTELVQDEMSAENLLNALDSANKDEFLQKSIALRKYLQKGSAQAVAKLLYDL
ncbi:hypothetical protein ACWIUD_01700 [Helicobacter sp. 23-1044]